MNRTASPGPAAFSAKGLRILVVDDSVIIRHLVRKTLMLHSYQVVEAVDGWDALALLEKDQEFALLIIDLAMPHLDGSDLIHRIRTNPNMPHFPIIVLTGADLDLTPRPLPVDAFVPKPFAPSALLQTVKELIAESQHLAT